MKRALTKEDIERIRNRPRAGVLCPDLPQGRDAILLSEDEFNILAQSYDAKIAKREADAKKNP